MAPRVFFGGESVCSDTRIGAVVAMLADDYPMAARRARDDSERLA
jgi:hypothetical protein